MRKAKKKKKLLNKDDMREADDGIERPAKYKSERKEKGILGNGSLERFLAGVGLKGRGGRGVRGKGLNVRTERKEVFLEYKKKTKKRGVKNQKGDTQRNVYSTSSTK